MIHYHHSDIKLAVTSEPIGFINRITFYMLRAARNLLSDSVQHGRKYWSPDAWLIYLIQNSLIKHEPWEQFFFLHHVISFRLEMSGLVTYINPLTPQRFGLRWYTGPAPSIYRGAPQPHMAQTKISVKQQGNSPITFLFSTKMSSVNQWLSSEINHKREFQRSAQNILSPEVVENVRVQVNELEWMLGGATHLVLTEYWARCSLNSTFYWSEKYF
jgi:hypothetical protein